jgi:hypothetical protein
MDKKIFLDEFKKALVKGEVEVLKCEITGNPCGTDTWEVNHPCTCKNCTIYLELLDMEKEIE